MDAAVEHAIAANNAFRWVRWFATGSVELAEAYRGAAVFALPSHDETQPISALEAAACRKPLVLANLPYAKQEFYERAILVDPCSVDAIARGLRVALNQPVEHCPPVSVIEQCRRENIGEAYTAIYRRLDRAATRRISVDAEAYTMLRCPTFCQPSKHPGDDRFSGGTRLRGSSSASGGDQPLVSVITAVYNNRALIAGCLESVLGQSYPNIEVIVMDGASSDGTVEVLQQYNDRIALWRSERDRGIYDAWNKALHEARGEWICFLGSDDEFLPDAVGEYMALAARNPQAEFLSSKLKVVHSSGYIRTLGCPWTWKRFSRTMCTPHVGAMHRRSLFDRLGTYDTSYRIVGDYELLLRARSQLNAAYMPVVTVMMRGGGASNTSIALNEQARAKIATGGRSLVLTALELYFEKAKTVLHPPVRYVLGKTVAR